MSQTSRQKQKPQRGYMGKLDNSIGDFGNHPFFVRKAEEAKEFIKKHGLPGEQTKRKTRRK